MSRQRWKCLDCKVDTGKIGEHYMLNFDVWHKAHLSQSGMLCIACLERRLGRKLTRHDFNKSHVNRIKPGESKSVRLISRLYA